ncbi:hypothetical protein CAEBREN_08863 [Caenorhabditis brenneri]|uniref:Uncharacterized protein n=1 Tax=Caenorhabditis brenneri TaxID=135651 RepID=G0P422_CAEBE|nr:hypothetical protein CAEBREN_08863 [Caenorhabditis brenneri]
MFFYKTVFLFLLVINLTVAAPYPDSIVRVARDIHPLIASIFGLIDPKKPVIPVPPQESVPGPVKPA